MANEAKKSKDAAPVGKGFEGGPILGVLQDAAAHMAWLRWFGELEQFNPNMVVATLMSGQGGPPVSGGMCGRRERQVKVRDLVSLAQGAEDRVNEVIHRLVGVDGPPRGMPGEVFPPPLVRRKRPDPKR